MKALSIYLEKHFFNVTSTVTPIFPFIWPDLKQFL